MENSLAELRKKNQAELSPSPFQINNFIRTSSIQLIIVNFSHLSREELEKKAEKVSVAGRIINRPRKLGKLVFVDLADQSGTVQLKVLQNESFAKVGDIIGVKGIVSKTD